MIRAPWVIIPTYNEKANIERLIPALFKQSMSNLSVLIVDDSSPDGTAKAVKILQQKYPRLELITRPKKEGLGSAYITGFKYALQKNADAIVQMDADLSHDPADVPKLLAALEHNDLVIGSRYAQGISVINWPLRRLFLSVAANFYAARITGMPFKDSTGGFKAWRAQVLQDINLDTVRTDGYGFQIQTTYRAWHQHKKIIESPIVFTERRSGQSKMSKAIIWEAFWLVWKLRLHA